MTTQQRYHRQVNTFPTPVCCSSASGEMDPPRGSIVSTLASIHSRRSQLLYQRFLSDAAAGLTFCPDAEAELGANRVSYSQADYSHLFRPTGALRPAANRRLYRPAPRLKHRQTLHQLPESRWLPWLLDSPESAGHPPPQRGLLLQDSCRRTRETEVRPYHEVAQIVFSDSEYFTHLQGRSPPTRNTGTAKKSVTTEPLSRDQDQDQDQDPPRQPQSDVNSWTAAQCVVLDGDQRRGVIERLLAQLFQDDQTPNTQDQPPSTQDQPPDVELVISQIIFLSSKTTLVRPLLAEQLNSSGWKSRLLACNILSRLKGPVNKDVVQKLIHLMWNDHSEQVRLAAAHTLMKLGKVQDVHNQLRMKLEDRWGLQCRNEALDLIHSLKLTSEQLLESLVSCLRDESPAVRKQACVSAASLLLKDETVESHLLELLENDPAREVRLSAINAVGALGLSSPDVQETLQCCVETEVDAELRLAACRLLQSVGIPSDKLLDFLLQQLEAESNNLVLRTMTETLHLCDCRLPEERRATRYISLQVKRLCEWRVIADKVLLLQKLQERKYRGRRLQRRTLSELLSHHYRTGPNKTPQS
ncbi:HEAT repeat-containing protein 4 isoform X2 [Trachinotus anak]|uniref:HEAT repeat-containing protein 4 isoform X2 n=1 Tax=Trachinotus anak TaxID=443729 RepID=UPI0039F1CFDA